MLRHEIAGRVRGAGAVGGRAHMSQRIQLNRRAFLRTAGMTAMAGAVGTKTMRATSLAPGVEPPDGKYDFDEIYDRTGTDCSKWDDQIKKYGKENIEVAMGVADMDFRCAPSITKALKERVDHENWGYGIPRDSYVESIVAWNKNRHGSRSTRTQCTCPRASTRRSLRR